MAVADYKLQDFLHYDVVNEEIVEELATLKVTTLQVADIDEVVVGNGITLNADVFVETGKSLQVGTLQGDGAAPGVIDVISDLNFDSGSGLQWASGPILEAYETSLVTFVIGNITGLTSANGFVTKVGTNVSLNLPNIIAASGDSITSTAPILITFPAGFPSNQYAPNGAGAWIVPVQLNTTPSSYPGSTLNSLGYLISTGNTLAVYPTTWNTTLQNLVASTGFTSGHLNEGLLTTTISYTTAT